MIKKKGIGITFDGIDEYLSWVDTREIKTDEEIHAAANHHPANLESYSLRRVFWWKRCWMVVSFEWWCGQIRENEDEMVRIEMPKVVRRSCREVEVRHNWSQDPSNFEPCSLHYCFFVCYFREQAKSIFGALLKIC